MMQPRDRPPSALLSLQSPKKLLHICIMEPRNRPPSALLSLQLLKRLQPSHEISAVSDIEVAPGACDTVTCTALSPVTRTPVRHSYAIAALSQQVYERVHLHFKRPYMITPANPLATLHAIETTLIPVHRCPPSPSLPHTNPGTL